MHPIKFEGANATLGKPDNMTDEQCTSLSVETGTDSNGFHYYASAWMPNKEDVEAINQGKPIWLKIVGNVHPPVALYTQDEEGKPNI